MDDIFIPIIGFLSITGMLVIFSLLNTRNQVEVQKTLRAALDRGVVLTPELVAQLNTNQPNRNTDLRRGIIIMSLGAAAIMAGVISGALTEFATISMFPIFMGLGFLLVWKMERSNEARRNN
jgi:Flp pilus assembly protein TadB